MPKTVTGRIIKSLGGFYYVESAGLVYECRGRGSLRSRGLTPTVGDECAVTVWENGLCSVDDISPRKNILARPAIANLDRLFVVVSSTSPRPNLLTIDRLIAACEWNDIEPSLIMTKLDLGDLSSMAQIYSSSGFKVWMIDYRDDSSLESLKEDMKGHISAFAGNSGVGKSTLLNALCPSLSQQTGETSRKLGRGRHTTRSVELFDLPFGGKIADTPGFSSFDNGLGANIPEDQIQFCFREFSDYLGKCKFSSCAHTVETGCAVLAAMESGVINPSRHKSYLTMRAEMKDEKTKSTKKEDG